MEKGKLVRPAKELMEGFRQVPTSTVATVMDEMGIGSSGSIISGLRPLLPGVRIAGAAFTIKAIAAERGTFARADYPVGEVVELTEKDDILVIDVGGAQVCTMGGLACFAMNLRGVAGLVVEGGVRDAEQIVKIGFPVYTRHVCATSGQTRVKWLAINVPIEIGSVRVCPGDIVIADDTSVAAVPVDKAEEILSRSQHHEELESRFEKELQKGKSFLEATRKVGSL
ncbi:RraA family protein [Chloroflexota bacterium]